MKVAALAFLLVAGPLFAQAAPADCIKTEQRSYLGIKTIAGPSRGLSLDVASSTPAAETVTSLCPGSSYTITAKGVSNPNNARARTLLTSTVGNFSAAGTCPGAATVPNNKPVATLLIPCNTTGSAVVAVHDVGTARDLTHHTATKTFPILGKAECPQSTCWAAPSATAAPADASVTADNATLPAEAPVAANGIMANATGSPATPLSAAAEDNTTAAPAANTTVVPVEVAGDGFAMQAPGSNTTDGLVPAVNGTTPEADTLNGTTVPTDGLVNSSDSTDSTVPVVKPVNISKAQSASGPAAAGGAAAGTKAKSAAGTASSSAVLAGFAAAGLVALLL